MFLLVGLLFCCIFVYGQSAYYKSSAEWLQKSESCKPDLKYKECLPLAIVKAVKDSTAFQGWRMEKVGNPDILFSESLKSHSGVILDFGEHITGNLSFSLKLLGNAVSDAPIRLKFTFAEVPGELNTPFDPYPGGLSRAWLQDEIITLMTVPVSKQMDRRVSFRYMKIDVLGASSFDFAFERISLRAQSSVDIMKDTNLAVTTSPVIRKINEVGLATLKECMQTVYEDGPKRDRRLWIGDLYKHEIMLLANLAN